MDNLPINDKLFLAQSQIIREAAEKGPCVIVGRCADYVLRENKIVCMYLSTRIILHVWTESSKNTTSIRLKQQIHW